MTTESLQGFGKPNASFINNVYDCEISETQVIMSGLNQLLDTDVY